MWDIYWILPLLTDCPIAVMTCWNVDAAYHQSLRKRATGIRPQRWKRECKEMLCWEVNGPASTKGVLWCSHKVWGQVFWCSVGVESSLASTGRNSRTLFQKSPCWVQTLLHNIALPILWIRLAWLYLWHPLCMITHTGCVFSDTCEHSLGWVKLGVADVWTWEIQKQTLFCLRSLGWHFKLKSFYLKI